ncbi:TasA family protein [Microbacterium sp. SS28]|uniref:TasA family protein n=1 Tax=Microbacterium sp. SS28 TaxID=2919948 RepID=UPI001FA984A7|nr:TasA family protein [Microbacterium sp. SS28]
MADAAAPQPGGDAKGRSARFWVLAAIIGVAIIVAGVLIYNASMAAFTATTDTGGDTFSTGTIDLSNDSEASSVFELTDLAPGDTGTDSVVVTYTGGDIDSEVRLYASTEGADQTLAADIGLTITAEGAEPSEWTGTLLQFQGLTTYADGILPVVLADGETETYTVTYEVLESAGQGESADVTFVWEAQSQ